VRLLLDTNVFLWWWEGSPRLPVRVRDLIRDSGNDIAVSIASLWEIAIKRALGKLDFRGDFQEVMTEEAFDLLAITYGHLRVLADLPRNHGDPFDRLLIAQSLAERMPIATADRAFAAYEVEILW
jgi:PIN domain nuclease of toxin-antitoxin system